MKKIPQEITVCNLEVIVMPNGEIISSGFRIGWFKDLSRFITVK
jgi:hypothetical protein